MPRDAGLLDDPPPDYGDAGITDQSTTTVTVRVDGRARRVDVYALDFTDGVTTEQRDNRERLTRLIQRAGDPTRSASTSFQAALAVTSPRQVP